jgi:hypothetical protein
MENKLCSIKELVEKYKNYKAQGLSDDVICKLLEIESNNMVNTEHLAIEQKKLQVIENISNSLLKLVNKDMKDEKIISDEVEETKTESEFVDADYDMRKDVPKFDISSFTDKNDLNIAESYDYDIDLSEMDEDLDSLFEEENSVWNYSIPSDYVKPNRYKPGQYKIEIPYGSSMARFYVSDDDLKELSDGNYDLNLNLKDTYRFYQGVGNNTGNPDVTGKYLKDVLTSIL